MSSIVCKYEQKRIFQKEPVLNTDITELPNYYWYEKVYSLLHFLHDFKILKTSYVNLNYFLINFVIWYWCLSKLKFLFCIFLRSGPYKIQILKITNHFMSCFDKVSKERPNKKFLGQN